MANFFIRRPIVAMVIAILMVLIGIVAMRRLPTAQFPNIVPPEIQVKATYPGADAVTVEQSVATPIEQQMSGVDNMNYMYSINANNGQMKLTVNFDIKTDPNTDQILAQMRTQPGELAIARGRGQLRRHGAEIDCCAADAGRLYSPKGTYDNIFLANYAYINLNDQFTRVPGIASVTVFGAGQYAMRCWVQAGQAGKAGPHGSGDRQGDPVAEHRESRRTDRRRAGAARAGVHLCRARPGPLAIRRGVRRNCRSREPRRLDVCG